MSYTGGVSQNRNRNITETENRWGNRNTQQARQEDAQNARGGNTNQVGTSGESTFVSAGQDNRVEAQGTGPGGVELNAHAAGPSLEITGGAEANVDASGVHLDVSLDVDATLAEAGAGATKTFTAEVAGEEFEITADLSALGEIGANGSVNLSIDIGTGGVNISASAEGFAGAQASISGGISVSHDGNEIASGSATLSATAGVSGSASANLDVSGSEISFGAQASASVGGGFGVEVEGTIDTAAAADAALDVAGAALREGAEEVAEFAAEFGTDVADFAGDRAEDVVNLAEDVGGFVVDAGGALVDAGEEVVDFLNPF